MLTTRTYDLNDENYLKYAGELSNRYVTEYVRLSKKRKNYQHSCQRVYRWIFSVSLLRLCTLPGV